MNIKKKRSFRELLRAALVVLLFNGVPVWLLMIAMVTENVWVCLGLIGYVLVSWAFVGRFDRWGM